MLNDEGDEVGERKIEDEERRFPISMDTDTKPTETTQEVVKEEVEGKFDQDEESFDDLDSIIGDIFSDYEEESNEE